MIKDKYNEFYIKQIEAINLEKNSKKQQALNVYKEIIDNYYPNDEYCYKRAIILSENFEDYEYSIQVCNMAIERIKLKKLKGDINFYKKHIDLSNEILKQKKLENSFFYKLFHKNKKKNFEDYEENENELLKTHKYNLIENENNIQEKNNKNHLNLDNSSNYNFNKDNFNFDDNLKNKNETLISNSKLTSDNINYNKSEKENIGKFSQKYILTNNENENTNNKYNKNKINKEKNDFNNNYLKNENENSISNIINNTNNYPYKNNDNYLQDEKNINSKNNDYLKNDNKNEWLKFLNKDKKIENKIHDSKIKKYNKNIQNQHFENPYNLNKKTNEQNIKINFKIFLKYFLIIIYTIISILLCLPNKYIKFSFLIFILISIIYLIKYIRNKILHIKDLITIIIFFSALILSMISAKFIPRPQWTEFFDIYNFIPNKNLTGNLLDNVEKENLKSLTKNIDVIENYDIKLEDNKIKLIIILKPLTIEKEAKDAAKQILKDLNSIKNQKKDKGEENLGDLYKNIEVSINIYDSDKKVFTSGYIEKEKQNIIWNN